MASPFASLDAEPSRVTKVEAVTVLAVPAFAVGAKFVAATVMVTVDGVLERLASRTTRLKVRVVDVVTVGAVNVGFTAVELDKATGGPPA